MDDRRQPNLEATATDHAPPNDAPETFGGDTTFAEVVRSLARVLGEDGNVKAVFGAPIKLDTHTIVPVARVAVGGGGGGVRALGATVDAVRGLFRRQGGTHVSPSRTAVGGGGLGLDVRPVGFLHEQDGRVVFTAIDDGGPDGRPAR